MIQAVGQFLKNVMLRIWLLYAVAFLVVYFMMDHKEAKWHSYAATLSRLQPPYDYLVKFNDGAIAYDRKELLAYRLFFSRLVRIIPKEMGGYAMLGYCQYYLGDTQSAIDLLTIAADKVPPFLWFNYDLGYLYVQSKQYNKAIEYLSKAVSSNSEIVFKFMASSKPYLDAIASVPGFQGQYASRVRTGLRDSYKLLVLSYFHLEQPPGVVAAAQSAIDQKLDDDGFFYYYLGVAAYYSGQLETAVMYFQQSIQRNPQVAESYRFLALALKDMGKLDLAAAVMKQAQIYAQAKGTQYEDLKNIRLKIF